MLSRRRARVDRSALPLPHTTTWFAFFWLVATLLFATIGWVGRRWASKEPDSWQIGFFDWIGTFFEGLSGVIVGRVGTETVPVSARLAALTLLIVLLVVGRRALIQRIAYLPGPVDVRPLEDASGEVSESQRKDLTAEFEHLLSETSLYPPPGVPEPPAGSVLDLVGDFDPAPKNLTASIIHFVARFRPKLAYRVKAALRCRKMEPRFGVTVTVTSYALGGCRMTTIWGRDWLEAINGAASWVVATILPVSRVGNQLPWRSWMGRKLPEDLFQAYQKASKFNAEQKYDEAMFSFYRALHLDPLNPHLRNALARVEMQAGLYIDALDMMQIAVLADRQSARDYSERLWATFGRRQSLAYLLKLRKRPDLIDVRYNYAALLGLYKDLPDHWCQRGEPGIRSSRRKEMRNRLIPAICERYWPVALDLVSSENKWRKVSDIEPGVANSAKDYIRDALESAKSKEKVRLIFQRAAAREIQQLAADYRLTYLVPKVRPNRTLTNLRLYRDLIDPLRIASALHDFCRISGCDFRKGDQPHGHTTRTIPWSGRGGDLCMNMDEYIEPDKLRHSVESYLRFAHWPLPLDSTEWQDHYNAACVYTLAMQLDRHRSVREKGSHEKDCSDRFADLAIEELKKALRSADSGFTTVATNTRWWLIEGDYDLHVLRGTRRFRAFAGHVYPREKEYELISEDGVQRRMAMYSAQLISDIARVMEQTWHQRAAMTPMDLHSLIEWFLDERDVWEGLMGFVKAQADDWLIRTELVHKVMSAAEPGIMAATSLPPRVPSREEVSGDWKPAVDLRYCLRQLERNVENVSPCGAAEQWIDYLREIDANAGSLPRQTRITRICSCYAAAWQEVADRFGSVGTHVALHHDAPEERFKTVLTRLYPQRNFERTGRSHQ